jgi:hypothetical protein
MMVAVRKGRLTDGRLDGWTEREREDEKRKRKRKGVKAGKRRLKS